MEAQNIIPVTLFLVIGATISIIAYLASKVRAAAQETLRAAIAAGQQLDENTVRALAARPSNLPESDLRAGLQGVATGLGFIISAGFCNFVSFDEDFSTTLAVIGIVVSMIGAGNLVSWKVRSNLPKNEG